ncbi:MAG: glycosyl transferase, WecB/TagA/CpsF family [Acidobacteriaceae bacterium]|nr:glycosyl transferase, WecB/TagA/CpsF family [Acidobacteriaceae bacterium]
MRAPDNSSLVDVLGVQIAPIDMNGAIAQLADALHHRTKGYVCLTGVHGVMEAHRNPELRPFFADSLLTAPDGIPMVWLGHWQGHTTMRQVTGPDLMLEVLSRPEFAGRTHFLFGGKPGVANELRHALQLRYPATRILGTYTPPFRELSPQEDDDLIATVASLRPDIIWVGISTPRQERFMHRMLPRLDTTLMFGVGAAFDFHTGRIRDSPKWVKSAGLQWLDRLIQDPRHLWKRYLRNNPTFLWHILLQLSHLRTYPSVSSDAAAASSSILHKVGHDL